MGVVPALAVPDRRADHRLLHPDVGRSAQPSSNDRLRLRGRQFLVHKTPAHPPSRDPRAGIVADLRHPARLHPQHPFQPDRPDVHRHRIIPGRKGKVNSWGETF